MYPSKFESQIFATVKLMSVWWNWGVREQDLGFRCKKTDTINNMYGKAFTKLWVSYTFFRVLLFSLKVQIEMAGKDLRKSKKNAEAWFVGLPPKRWITFDPKTENPIRSMKNWSIKSHWIPLNPLTHRSCCVLKEPKKSKPFSVEFCPARCRSSKLSIPWEPGHLAWILLVCFSVFSIFC